MSRRRKLCIGLLSGAAAAVAITLLSMRPNWLYEEWYIHRLQSADVEQRIQAAEKLGEMQSVRTVPAILEAIQEQLVGRFPSFQPRKQIVAYVDPLELLWGEDVDRMRKAIVGMGKAATLKLLQAIHQNGTMDDTICGMLPEVILWDIYSADLRRLAEMHAGNRSHRDELLVTLRDDPTLPAEIRTAAGEALSRLKSKQ